MEDNELYDGQLGNDLNEAELLEPKRGPGRSAGTKNNSTNRSEILKRFALHRQRKREKLEGEIKAREYTDNVLQHLHQNGFTLFGELEGCRFPSMHQLLITSYFSQRNMPKRWVCPASVPVKRFATSFSKCSVRIVPLAQDRSIFKRGRLLLMSLRASESTIINSPMVVMQPDRSNSMNDSMNTKPIAPGPIPSLNLPHSSHCL
jgi:hypothetical protein